MMAGRRDVANVGGSGTETIARSIVSEKARQARRIWSHRRKIEAYLRAHPCVDCGETDLRCLHFDHRDGEKKVGAVSHMVSRSSWRRIWAEIQKCDVRCANCHQRRTAEQYGWWSALAQRTDPAAEPEPAG